MKLLDFNVELLDFNVELLDFNFYSLDFTLDFTIIYIRFGNSIWGGIS